MLDGILDDLDLSNPPFFLSFFLSFLPKFHFFCEILFFIYIYLCLHNMQATNYMGESFFFFFFLFSFLSFYRILGPRMWQCEDLLAKNTYMHTCMAVVGRK